MIKIISIILLMIFMWLESIAPSNESHNLILALIVCTLVIVVNIPDNKNNSK